jgi:hypothetical protein
LGRFAVGQYIHTILEPTPDVRIAQFAVRHLLGTIKALELAFHTKLLRKLCETEAESTRALGTKVSEMLRRRLADLRAATSIEDIVVGRLRPERGADAGNMQLDLCDGYGISFCANHVENPMTGDDEIDWSRVSRIKILNVGTGNG